MDRYYILEGKTPVQVRDVSEWATKFENQNRIVEQTEIRGVKISTVFLGLDHSSYFEENNHPPFLFETMIFGGKLDQYQERYPTWDEAIKGHHKACKEVVELN